MVMAEKDGIAWHHTKIRDHATRSPLPACDIRRYWSSCAIGKTGISYAMEGGLPGLWCGMRFHTDCLDIAVRHDHKEQQHNAILDLEIALLYQALCCVLSKKER